MEKHQIKTKFVFTIILILAFLLRVIGLNKVPPELFGDELDVGYQAYSILLTGKDYQGQTLPLYIHSFSEWRSPLLMYVTAPFIAVFGLNEWGVRLPSACFALITILFLFLLVRKTFASDKIALISASFLAISPWHIQFSRAAFEVSLLLALILSAVYFFIISFNKPKFLFLSAALFSLTFYTYSTAVLFVPLLIILLIINCRKNFHLIPIRNIAVSILVFAGLVAPIAYNIIFGYAAQRYSQFSVFSDMEISHEIDVKRSEGGNTFVERIFHNKPIFWMKKILANYTSAFSGQFLFKEGDVTFRHSIHSVGEFYWIELPFALLGIFVMTRKKNEYNTFFIIWLLLAPIPSSLTKDGAIHATRLILMLPPLTVIMAVGFDHLTNLKHFRKKIISIFISALFLLEFTYYSHSYFFDYPKESWRWWQEGYKEAILYMKSVQGSYKKIVFNNTYEPSLIRFLFWWQYPPAKFQAVFKGDGDKVNILANFTGFELEDRYYFGYLNSGKVRVENFVDSETMYLVSQTDEVGGDWDWGVSPPDNIKVLKIVRNPYGQPIFYVIASK